jgi:para-nitrobenzyl esterase
MPDSPLAIFEAGEQNSVPCIINGNLGEITGPGFILMPGIIPDYVEMMSSSNKEGVQSYAYIFDQLPSNWRKEGGASCHALETNYMFGNVESPRKWALVSFLAIQAGAQLEDPGVTDADRRVSEDMMSMWAQFMKTGNPSIQGITWPPYDSSSDQYLYIVDSPEVKSGFSKIGSK